MGYKFEGPTGTKIITAAGDVTYAPWYDVSKEDGGGDKFQPTVKRTKDVAHITIPERQNHQLRLSTPTL